MPEKRILSIGYEGDKVGQGGNQVGEVGVEGN
jgi:hypothetical protein